MNKIEKIIQAIRESDPYIVEIYTKGGCYQFSKILGAIYPGKVYHFYSTHKGHVISLIDGEYYDIRGKLSICEDDGYLPMSPPQQKEAEKWSFGKYMVLVIKECPFCHEPITV